MLFNLKKTAISKAVKISKNPVFRIAKPFGIICVSIGIILFLLFSAGALEQGIFSDKLLNQFLGSSLVLLSSGLLFLELNLFLKTRIAKPKLQYLLYDFIIRPDYLNSASFLDFESVKALNKANKIAKGNICGISLLLGLIESNSAQANFIFQRTQINVQDLKNKALQALTQNSEQNFEKIILASAKRANQNLKQRISPGDILTAIAEQSNFFKNFLLEQDLNTGDIDSLSLWQKRIVERISKDRKFWTKENLLKRGSLAKDFVAGFSITLDKYSSDLREKISKTGQRQIIGHKEEIKQVENILTKKDLNNVLLIGQPGIGRKSIVEAVSQRAFSGKTSPALNYKRFLEFDPSLLSARITSLEQAEAELDTCFRESAQAGNIVLIINNFENFIKQEQKQGSLNVISILARYLSLSSFQIIAITSFQGLHNIIEKNPSMLNMFEKVEAEELSKKETMIFLQEFVPFFEARHQKFITHKALRQIIELGSKYLTDIPFPEKAIRLLDEAVAVLSNNKQEKILLERHIKGLVSRKTQVSLQDLEGKEKQVLLDLEKLIHKRVVNQNPAVNYISSAMRRARADVKFRNGPIGSFLFLGPTGVGKTETSKAITEVYFGSEKKMIRLDMSGFQSIEDIKRLIGSDQIQGILTTAVRENPFSLVLLDEIEKAHPNILNIFLQVLDEAWITDGFGRKIDFSNTIIIATSNAGSEIIRQDIAKDKKMDMIKDDLLDHLFRNNKFRPEFINRFDAVVVFKPLEKHHFLQIARLMLSKLAKNLLDKGIKFESSQQLEEKIVELSYSPVFGAREMRRTIQDKVENVLANAILSNELTRGNLVKIEPENFDLVISKI